ncbi:MAG: hypothetical protein JO339_32360 [Alphaproteobacteria bacterium]|nr:hypothetical protein [Alphaproteobacteria bacterium]
MRPVYPLSPFSNPASQAPQDDPKRQNEPSASDQDRFKKALQSAASRKETQRDAADRKETRQVATDRKETRQVATDRTEAQRRTADQRTQDQSALDAAESLMARRGLFQQARAMAEAANLKEDSSAAGEPSDQADDEGEALSKDATETTAKTGGEARTVDGPARCGKDRGNDTAGSDERDDQGEDARKGHEVKASDGERTSETGSPPASVADRVLSNIAPNPEEPSAPAPTGSGADMADMVRELADRIMIGESGPGGQQEVRIMLKNQVLGGTEIRVSEFEGSLNVHFLAGSPEAEGFLQGRRQEITNALGERLRRSIRVEVTDRESRRESADEGAARSSDQRPGRRQAD